MAKKIKSKQLETVKKVTGAVTLSAPEFLYVDTTVGSATITFPVSPFADDHIRVYSYQNTVSSSNTITINPNGKAINGNTSNVTLNRIQGKYVDYVYDGFEWKSFEIDPSSVYHQNTAPIANNSIAGDFWWDDINLKLNILHDDGTTKTWVDVTGASSNTTGLQIIGQYHANTNTLYDLFGTIIPGGLPLPNTVPIGTAYTFADPGVLFSDWALSRPGQMPFSALEGDYLVNDGSQFKWLQGQFFGNGQGDTIRSDNGNAPTRRTTTLSLQNGDLWIDTARDKINMYDSGGWLPVGNTYSSVANSTTIPAFPKSGDLWYDTTNSIFKVHNGTTWINVTSSPTLNIVGGWQNSPGPTITDIKGATTGLLPAPNTLSPGTAYITLKNANSTNWGLSGVPFTNTTPVSIGIGDILFSDGGSYHVLRQNDVNSGSGDQINSTTTPTVRTTTHPLQGGDLWFDSTANTLSVYNATTSTWQDVAKTFDIEVGFYTAMPVAPVKDTIYIVKGDADWLNDRAYMYDVGSATWTPIGPVVTNVMTIGAGNTTLDTDYVKHVYATTTAGQANIFLPASPIGGQTHTVYSGGRGTDNIVVTSGSTIDGAASYTMTPTDKATTFVYDDLAFEWKAFPFGGSTSGVDIQTGALSVRPATPTEDTIYIVDGDTTLAYNNRISFYDTGAAKWFDAATKAMDCIVLGSGTTTTLNTTTFKHALVNTNTSASTINLPTSPVEGQVHYVFSGNRGLNNITVNGNGNTIEGSASYIITPTIEGVFFIWNLQAARWDSVIISQATIPPTQILSGTVAARPATPTTDTVYVVKGDLNSTNDRVYVYETGAAAWTSAYGRAIDAPSTGSGTASLDNDVYKNTFIFTASGQSNIFLPSSPRPGEVHHVYSGSRGTSNIVISGNTATIDGSASYTMTPTDKATTFVYDEYASEWKAYPFGTTGGTPAGSTSHIQFNNAGAFGANANFTFAQANSTLTVSGNTAVTGTATFNDITSTGRTTQSIDDIFASGIINCSSGNLFKGAISASTTYTFTNVPTSGTGYMCTLQLKLNAAVAVTWPAAVKWPNNLAPTLVNGKSYLIMFYTNDGGTNWFGSALPDYAV